MPWTQNYDPFHQQLVSTLVAALPIVLLLVGFVLFLGFPAVTQVLQGI